ncbi:MAG: hypothetical protein ACKOKF_08760 [Bacteroidota bacterium]
MTQRIELGEKGIVALRLQRIGAENSKSTERPRHVSVAYSIDDAILGPNGGSCATYVEYPPRVCAGQ